MKKITIAVGSKRGPKLSAVTEALQSFSATLAHDAEFEVVGVELAVAIDRFAGTVGIRDAQGAWGVLSNNFISRQEAFRVAVIAAFAPFYNSRMYRIQAAGASNSLG